MSNRGTVLLEVMIALTVFAFGATASLGLLRQLDDAERRGHEAARTADDEDRLMSALTLLTAPELDQQLGQRAVGPYLVEVQRPQPSLYRIAIGDSAGLRMATLVYRRVPR